MERIFAVIRSRGDGWNSSLPLEQQEDWRPHAAFMNADLIRDTPPGGYWGFFV
ncbi:MAG TPA: hypothetical protein VK419_14975 [Bryobacteraceae bacterium]|nr:hypothetical protein [Bryobacteraceae bacterium]